MKREIEHTETQQEAQRSPKTALEVQRCSSERYRTSF